MIVISNYSQYHTPYQVQGLLEDDPTCNLVYFNAVKPSSLKRICPNVASYKMRNFFPHFAIRRAIRKIPQLREMVSQFDEDEYEDFVCKNLHTLSTGIEIFHAFNCSALKTMKILPKDTIKIVECGVHPRTYREICQKEYSTFGVDQSVLSDKYVHKSEEEFNMADYILTISDICVKSFHQNGLPDKKIIKLPIAANLEGFGGSADRNQVFTVLYVGRVTVLKGVHYLLEACKRLIKSGCHIHCNIVGPVTDDYMRKLKVKYNGDANIVFWGARKKNELNRLYSEASVMVMPSLVDSFCMSVYEALSCATPVIITENVGAHIDDGINGFIVPIRNVDAMADKIAYFYSHREQVENFGSKGYEMVKNYTWKQYGNNLRNLYNNLKRHL